MSDLLLLIGLWFLLSISATFVVGKLLAASSEYLDKEAIMNLPDVNERARGRIYSDPARVRCGECAEVLALTDVNTTAAKEAHDHGWVYTLAAGWVCPTCAPLPRLMDDEPNRVRHGE